MKRRLLQELGKELQELSKEQLIDRIIRLESKLNPQLEEKNKKIRRPMQWSKFTFRPVVFHVLYLGWPYHGVAYQPAQPYSVEPVPTVEGEFFEACKRIRVFPNDSVEDCHFSRSGRTDAGVSAFCQMFGMRVRSNLSQEALQLNPMQTDGELDYLSMLNGNLPSTIRVLGWAPMPICSIASKSRSNEQPVEKGTDSINAPPKIEKETDSVNATPSDELDSISTKWNARFSCSFRQYKYLFLANKSLNIEAMRQAANHLIGEHNFRFFCRMDENTKTAPPGTKNYQRIIEMVEIKEAFDSPSSLYRVYQFNVRGSGFLYNQIRCIMGVLYHVGLGKEDPSIVSKMLLAAENSANSSLPKPSYEIASEKGLILWDCGYLDEFSILHWVRSSNWMRTIVKPLMNELNEYESRSSIIKTVLQELVKNEEYGINGEEIENDSCVLPYSKVTQSIGKFMSKSIDSVAEN